MKNTTEVMVTNLAANATELVAKGATAVEEMAEALQKHNQRKANRRADYVEYLKEHPTAILASLLNATMILLVAYWFGMKANQAIVWYCTKITSVATEILEPVKTWLMA